VKSKDGILVCHAFAKKSQKTPPMDWELQAKITSQIKHNFEVKNIKVARVARDAETSRSRVSNLIKGRDHFISLDVLVEF
jgi:predicted XRE-type DNA-binding protein